MKSTSTLLSGDVVPVAALARDEREDMFRLMSEYFGRLDAGRFHSDLDEKPWAVLLRDGDGRIMGFSTLDIMRVCVKGVPVSAVYSGDTITDREYWSTAALPRAFLRFIALHTGVDRDDTPWYWFYVCKGFRTYRFLPIFYQTFFPRPGIVTPTFEHGVMRELSAQRFGAAYDGAAGVVRVADDYALRAGIGDLTDARKKDPYIRYFADRNPGWTRGEELVCLAPLSRNNLHPRAQRWLDEERLR